MSAKSIEDDIQKDERAKAVDRNPCSMCRALGMPTCKGHGGGGGGGGSSSDTADAKSSGASATSISFDGLTGTSTSIEDSLSQNPAWTQSNQLELTFLFAHPNALLSIKLDMGQGRLTFSGDKDLTRDQRVVLGGFFKAIELELNDFKKELSKKGIDTDSIKIAHEGNNLTIKIPTPKYYDAFVQRLINKNLLPTLTPELSQEKRRESAADKSLVGQESAEQTSRSTAPNPFDIRKGPQPTKWTAKD